MPAWAYPTGSGNDRSHGPAYHPLALLKSACFRCILRPPSVSCDVRSETPKAPSDVGRFELNWRQIAQARMQPLGIIDDLDECVDVGFDLCKGLEVFHVDFLAFERLKETLGLGVLVGIDS